MSQARSLLAVALWLTAASALAQTDDPADRSGDEETQRGVATVPTEPEAPVADAPRDTDYDATPVLPAPEFPAGGSSLSLVPTVQVRSIIVEGQSLLPAAVVDEIVSPYEGRAVTAEELDVLRNRLSLAYFDAGFVNSGVVLPDQPVDDGVIRFQEVTGNITTINLEGNDALRDHWWLRRLERATDGAFQINRLQDTLQVMEQEPLVQRIEASLRPGLEPGEGILDVRVTETTPWRLDVGVDNHRSPSLGGEQATIRLAHLSVTGNGDRLELYGNYADGLGDGGIDYTLPLGAAPTAVRAYFSGGFADIVEAPFDIVDIQSETRTLGLEVSHPVWRTPGSSLFGFLGVEARHSESTLLDRPFSFSLGEIEGEADTSVLRGGVNFAFRDERQALALQLTMRFGTDWYEAAVEERVPPGLNGPDTDFIVFQGQGQYIRRLDWLESELHVRAAAQLANDPLLPVEKMPIGGAWSVRGYRENLLVRDNGLTASAEWRVPLFRGRDPVDGFDWRALTAVAFADWGQSWDQDTGLPSDDKVRVSSIGLGGLWSPLPRLSMQLFFGEALDDVGGSGDALQDRGWHWRIGYRVF